MSTLGLPAAILRNLFKPRHAAAGRFRRRPSRGERSAYALMDALETRQLLSATHLGFDVQPTNTVAGHSISTVTVNILDNNNALVSSNALVTFSLATAPSGESLFFAVQAVNGVVTLDGLSFITAGNYTLRAASTGLTAAVSSSFAITPDAANHLQFTSQPSSTTAGQTISTLTVAVRDQYDNLVTGNSSNVTLALASGSGTLLGTTTVAAVSGIATFSDLGINTSGTYTLGATDGGLVADTSGSFSISAAAASKLVITQQPGNVTAGQNISTILVSVQDAYDNVVTNNTSSVTIALASGSGTLLGTKTVSAVSGVATFSTLSLHEAGSFTLGVSDGGLTTATSSSFTVNAASATHLVFTQQPGNITAGALGTVAVSVEDQYGNVVTSDTSTVTLSIGTGSGTLGGTLSVAAISGVATFSNLAITKAGSYTLNAADGSLTGATSSSFSVTRDAAAKLVITQQPGSTIAGQTISTITVAVRDQYDNLVTDDSSNVVIAIASGSGTLLGTKTVAASGGIATFSTLSIHEAGSFTLGVTDGALTAATSGSFTISPDTATQLVFTQQPGNISAGNLGTVTVKIEDQYGNVSTTANSTVTLSAASGPGSLLGTVSVAAVNGVATFSGLAIHTAGTYTLGAVDGSLTAATSSSFTVSPLSGTHLAFTAQPTSMVAGNLLTGITAAIKDQYENTVTGSSANVTFRLTGGGSTFTFVVAASSGVATLNSVYLVKAGSYSVRATSSGLTLADSNSITVTPDVASQLVMTQDTGDAVAGHTLSSIVVEVQDQFGNLITNNTTSVTIAIASGTGSLLGTKTVSAPGGIATFSTLSIQQADDFTLTVSDGSLTTATTEAFTISPDAAAKLEFTTQPVDATAGNTLTNVLVSVEDQYGNLVTTDSSSVVVAIASGTGTLLGTKTVAASNGVATFSTLSIEKSGSFTLSATDSSLTADTSDSFTILADDATHLSITQQPTNGKAGLLSTIVVSVLDQYNNLVLTDNSDVSIAIDTGTGSLLGTTTVSAVNGVATFSDLAFHTPGARTLEATDGSLTAATTNSFTISPDDATHLVISQDTSSDTAGHTLSTILVEVQDQYGNVVTNNTSSVTIAIASGTGTLLGTKTVSAVSGVATFSTLSIQKSGAFTLSLSDGSLMGATTASFTISPDAAHHLAITQQISNSTAGHTLSALVVAVQDQYNNVVTTDSSNVVLAIATGTGTLLGTTTVAATSGIATFSTLSIEEADAFTLSVTDGALASATSSSFTISPDIADHVAITVQPSNGLAINALSPVIASIKDQYGNTITTDSSTVITLSLHSGGVDYYGESILAVNHGVAVFDAVHIPVVGTYTLELAADDLTSAISNSFTISHGPASRLDFTTGPANTVAGQTLSSIVVKVLDAEGNIVTNNASNIVLTLDGGAGTASGTTTVAAINGVATFSDLSIVVADSYQLIATAPVLFGNSTTGDISDIFTITPDTATKLVFTQGPANHAAGVLGTIKVAVEDQFGNIVTSDTSTVTLAIASGSGTLLGTISTAAVAGVATFSAAAIHVADSYTLGASDGSLTSVISGSFTVSAAAASQLVLTQQPTNTVAGQTISAIIAKVEDQYGNVVTTDTSSVTIAMSSGNVTLSGTKVVSAVAGVATFGTLSINTTGSYTLTVTDGSLTSGTTGSFTITPDAATHLSITQGPTTTVAGHTISTINVAVQDQFNNVVTTDTSDITIALIGSGATLSGTKTITAVNGTVSFTTLSMTQTGTYTMRVTDTGLTSADSSSFSITPDAAHHLTITQDAANATAGQTLSAIVVAVRDQYENVVTNNTSSVSIAIASGTGSLLGTTTVAAVSGIATFSTLSIQKSGAFTLSLSDGSLTGATTASFTVTPATASQLVFTTQPANAVAGALMSTVSVAVEDQYGNIVTTNSSNISLSVNNGGVTITLIVAASSGVASFGGIALTKSGTFAFKATGAGQPAAFSNNFTISPDVATTLSITQQPANGSAGTLSTILVAVHDQYGNVVTTDSSSVSLALTTGSATLSGTTTVSAVNGIATFNAVTLTKPGTYTVAATDGSLTGETSSSFTITPAIASQLVITQQTSSTTAGQTLSSLQVSIEDQYGNVVTNNTSSVTIAIASGTGTLLGTTTVAAVSGVATFSTLSIQKSGSFTLSVSDGSLTGATSSSLTISPDVASQLAFTQQPANGTAGTTLSTILVAVQDQYGNVVTSNTSNVTLTLSNGTVTLNGTATAAAVSGVATFSGLSINKTGSFTFAATDTGLTSATSSSFTVTSAAASKLVITQQPSSGTVGTLSTVLVAVEDQYDNIVTNNTSSVTIALTSGTGSLLGTTTVAASSGVASFSTLGIHTPGSYSLTVTDGGLTSATSNSISLTAGAAHHLHITQQISTTEVGNLSTLMVAVEDQYSNVVTTDSSSVTVAIATGTGTLLGTKTVSASSGIATFSTLGIHTPGSFTLAVTDGSLTSATSSSFTLAAGAADHLDITQQPSNGTVGGLGNVTVAVQDQYNNVVTNNTSSVTIALTSGTGSLLGTTTVAAVNGVATFSTLGIHTPGSYSLTVTDGSLTSDATSSFTLTAGAASRLHITQQPATGTVGTLSTILIAVEDQYGNRITTDTSSVTLAILTGPGTLTGTTVVSAVNGIATFSAAAITKSGDYTLRVTDGELTNATTDGFTLSHGEASKLTITAQPGDITAGGLETLTVAVQDQYGNVVTDDASEVSIQIASGTGTLGGTTTVTAVNGVATFDDLAITTADDYTLSVSDGELTAATSNEFTVSPSEASQLVITSGPQDILASNSLSTITVAIEDQYGNVVTTDTSEVSIEIATGEGSLSGTTTVSAINGVATFSGLAIRQAGTYSLTISTEALETVTTDTFDVSAAAPARIHFTTEPETQASRTLGTLTAEIRDQYGNLVDNATTSVTLAVATGPGTLSGVVTVNAVEGVATFTNVTLSKNGAYTLRATSSGLTLDTTDSFVVGAKLVFQKQPATTVAGVTIGPLLKVSIVDASNKIITTENSDITLSLFSGPGELDGTLTATAVNGVATFDDLSITTAGTNYRIQADSSTMTLVSNVFTIKPAATTQMVIQQDVSNTIAGVKIGPNAVTIKFMDAFNNLAINDHSAVTMAVNTGPTGGLITGTAKVNIANGFATFSNLVFKKSGTYSLQATAGGLNVTTDSFTVSAAAAKKILITQQPGTVTSGSEMSPGVTVDIVDAFGNLATVSSNVTLTLASGPTGATLNTTLAATNGRATFSHLSFVTQGKYKIKAAVTGLSTLTSNQFVVTPNLG